MIQHIYTNPYTGTLCNVEWEGATRVRVEDLETKSTRILTYEALRKEQKKMSKNA